MLLDGSKPDLGDVEATIRGLLATAEEVVDSNVADACSQFEIILASVCRFVPGHFQCRYWSLDDFYCTSVSRGDDVVTLQGVPYWLSGGQGCDRFRLDVALQTQRTLYSFKFTNSMSGEQLLYVGKTRSGWLINGP